MPTMTFTDGPESYTVTGSGDYILDFRAGNDTLTVDGGTSTTAHMGNDDDVVRLLSGAATVYGDLGVDTFAIFASNVTGNGGDGNDVFNLRAGSGQTLNGDDGNDLFNFINGITNVTVNGGVGNDEFQGRDKTISGSIYGGVGDDFFTGFNGTGAVTLYGGTGNDVYHLDPLSPATFVEFSGEGIDSVQVARGFSYTLPKGIENLFAGSYTGSTDAAATLTGNGLENRIAGSTNDDTLYGLAGNDKLQGLAGSDTIYGDTGSDAIEGGAGNDFLYGGGGNDVLKAGAGNDYMAGGAGDDAFYVDSLLDQVVENAGEGRDVVRVTVSNYVLPAQIENGVLVSSAGLRLDGNSLDNILNGAAGKDSLYGQGGNDTINASGGDDLVDGGAGNDILSGGVGNDKLYGRAGIDTLTGNSGHDTFVFASINDSKVGTADSITDFSSTSGAGAADDTIDLSAIDADSSTAGNQAFAYSTFTPTAHSAWIGSASSDGAGGINWVLFADVNGDTTPDFELHFHTAGSSFSPDDIVW